jgi:DNA-binding transcriptional MerR regulator/quercetin dioxygenase-like cupin family protein
MAQESNSQSQATAYTVRQVARLSGVSVRTLHFYDEVGLLKPAYQAPNGYRFYEEPQLLILQQILFYRELGFELKQIRDILGRPDFEKVTALMSHRKVLEETLARTRRLLQTIDKTAEHLKGGKQMTNEEMFVGFTVAPGRDRFDEHISLGGEPIDCKLSGRDTGGALSVFELTGTHGGPRHLHHDQDEWVYVVTGSFDFEVGDRKFRATAGESVFLPRKVGHVWISATDPPGRTILVYQPAGRMEEFYREIGKFDDPPIHEALSFDEFCRLFQEHGMELVGPPPPGWSVEDGQIIPPPGFIPPGVKNRPIQGTSSD